MRDSQGPTLQVPDKSNKLTVNDLVLVDWVYSEHLKPISNENVLEKFKK